MSSCQEFFVSFENLLIDIKRLDDEAELTRRCKFIAARKIQAWFRGIATRNHIHMLNIMAIVIQRHWRGHRGRFLAKKYLIDRVNTMWQNCYDRSATRIQAAWRGYWTRKNGFDIYRMKNWISSVYEKNERTRERMQSFRKAQIQLERNEIEKDSLLWILFILFKLHHLLGTKNRPGIVTSIDRSRSTAIEKMIKCLEYSVYMENKKVINCKNAEFYKQQLFFRGTRFERCEREIRNFERCSKNGDPSIKRSNSFTTMKKCLQIQVDGLAKEMWGTNYQENIYCQLDRISCYGSHATMKCINP